MKHFLTANHTRLTLFLALFLMLGTACQVQLVNPPRLATATAQHAATATPTAVPLVLPAPTPTAVSDQADEVVEAVRTGQSLEVWINETSPAHEEALQAMVTEFNAESGVNVTLRQVSPLLLPELVNTAVLSGTLPGVILHPIEYTIGWAERDILDPAAADAIVDEIGRDTFDPAALELLALDGQTAAIPSDGYQQLWLYRNDWYEDRGLSTPDSYTTMLAGAEALFDPENVLFGVVIPTESNLITTHRAFEQIAMANGCQLIDEQGEVRLLEPACREALDFYFTLINRYSPPGVQTDTSARNAFLNGRTGLIMSSPAILPDLADVPELAENTAVITRLQGNNPAIAPTNFGNITALGITPEADEEAAAAFLAYWFDEGYEQWLAVDAERKVPMRWGTAEQPRQFIDAWGTQPVVNGRSLQDIYGEEVVAQLRDGIADTNRWGFRQGQGGLITSLYEELTFSIVLQEMLSGYFTSDKTIFEAYNRVIELLPNYQFPIVPTPTPAN